MIQEAVPPVNLEAVQLLADRLALPDGDGVGYLFAHGLRCSCRREHRVLVQGGAAQRAERRQLLSGFVRDHRDNERSGGVAREHAGHDKTCSWCGWARIR